MSRWRRRVFHVLVAGSPLLLVLAVAIDRSRGSNLDPAGVFAEWQHRPQRCVACHAREAEALSEAHQVQALGCSSCHLGNPLSLDKDRAHAGLERFPGDLRSLKRTCGREGCHPDASSRVRDSLMATARGLLAVDRYVFGEHATPDGEEGFPDLESIALSSSPATEHARKLCASCHLGTSHVSSEIRTRGGGCTACHLQQGGSSDAHPRLGMGVSSGKCTGCHARSGRIALSYYGWHEGEVACGLSAASAPPVPAESQRLADGREVHRTRPDVHADAGLGCLDCHTSVGVMGDGQRYAHEEEQVDIHCTDCHQVAGEPPRTSPLGADEDVALRIAAHFDPGGPWSEGAPVVRTARGTPLTMLHVASDGTWWLRSRVGGRDLAVRPVPADAAHNLVGHERLSCQACHTTWSHQCAGCHTKRDAGGQQWDSVSGAVTAGRWVEAAGDVRVDRPTLGVAADDTIRPFLPGMPICLGERERCRRYFAPSDPHTTQREARPCASCHLSPLALGLGRGELSHERDTWRFVPATPPSNAEATMPTWPDGVPWDGWTKLEGTEHALSTRVGSRPFNPDEMRRALRVSACLPCHGEYGDRIYRDFAQSVRRLESGEAPDCAAP